MDETLNKLAVLERHAYAAKSRAEEVHEEAKAILAKYMEASGYREAEVDLDGSPHKAIYIAAERIKYNERAMKSALHPETWRLLVEEKVSNAKVLTALQNGWVDPLVVNSMSTIVQNKPYVKYVAIEPEQEYVEE